MKDLSTVLENSVHTLQVLAIFALLFLFMLNGTFG